MKIIVTSPSFSKNTELSNGLLKYLPESILNTKNIRLKGKELLNYVKDADGLIVGLEKIDQNLFKN